MPSECRIAAGSRVRFNAAGLRWMTPNKAAPKRSIQVEWGGRTGVVVRISKDGTLAAVKWGACKVPGDYVPVRFLELAPVEIDHVAA